MDFLVNPTKIDPQAVSDLLASRGMRARSAQEMRQALAGSSDVVAAYDGTVLVGFGRLISDGVWYGSIWDVAVRAGHEGRGIGTRIVNELLSCARRRGLYMVGLFAAPRHRAFYERLGFVYLQEAQAMTLSLAPGQV
jgi:GNAT superfamily N-acetyltransferase